MRIRNWEKFENEASEYLKSELEKYGIIVEHNGGADSTVPDIKIVNKNDEFYVEAKIQNAQSSQFVVKIENKSFVYSSQNKYPSNIFCEQIIEELNENFDLYSLVDQSGMFVPVPDILAVNCIISNMKNKNVKYLITIDEDNNKRIIPVDDFMYFFNVITKFRTKKSGSREIAKKYINDFKNKFHQKFPNYDINIISEGKKSYIIIPEILNEKQKYISSDVLPGISQYYLSEKEKNKFEIRITSNTNNANIIFEITTKNGITLEGYNIDSFINELNIEKE